MIEIKSLQECIELYGNIEKPFQPAALLTNRLIRVQENQMSEETLAPMSECIFAMGEDEGETFFVICRKSYWDKYHCVEDLNVVDVPEGFYDLMEATWEYDGDPAEGRRKLEEAGAKFDQAFSDFAMQGM